MTILLQRQELHIFIMCFLLFCNMRSTCLIYQKFDGTLSCIHMISLLYHWYLLYPLSCPAFAERFARSHKKHSYILLNYVTHLTASNDLTCFWFFSPTLIHHLEQYDQIQSVLTPQPFLSELPNVLEAAKAGVPEHFNAPFHLAKERGLYEAKGIDMQILGWKTWCCLGVFGAGSI